ncbi:MAG: potassium transporter TrkG [Candidatus Omnitrophota bacterium]
MKDVIYSILYRFRNSNPIRLVALGYLTYVVVGWALLCVPYFQKTPVVPLDNLFIASSAISTTGLATVDVASSYNFLGQLVVLILIQLGGIGYMTFGSFVILSAKRTLEEDQKRVMHTVFSIPKDFKIEKFIKSVVGFSFFFELLGAIALLPVFLRAGVDNPVWQAVFHSISAFCTAGFSLFPNSMENFKDNIWLNVVVSALSILGAMGFIVCVDAWRVITGKIKEVTFTTRIIVVATFWLLVIGTVACFLTEPFGGQVMPDKKILYSFFQIMTALTTVGFNTVPINALSESVILLLTFMMIIGASPSGTGGGLKTTTFSAIIGLVRSTCRGDSEVKFWGRRVPDDRVKTAVATFVFYVLALSAGTYLLTLTDSFPFSKILFESASALGTVGLSMGITSSLTALGKFIIILMMFVGRVSPLSLGVSLFVKSELIFDDDKTDLAV